MQTSLPSSSFVERFHRLSVASVGHWPSTEPQVTEEEIKVLIEQGTEAGTFEEAEQEMVERVFRLGDRPVNALVTPRPDIVWLDLRTPRRDRKIMESAHSRFPVCQGGLDNVLGMLHVTDLLGRSLSGQALTDRIVATTRICARKHPWFERFWVVQKRHPHGAGGR